ncbi:MAG: DNA translocase FtsK [Planctomycetes bacterium]|nr:DNA translocase FtsK [Planctomycetota bacterium]
MSQPRRLSKDLLALSLLALAVFLAAALGTYDPADPAGELLSPLDRVYHPDAVVYPQNEQAANLCGRWGALLSDLLLTSLGLGAWYLPASAAVLGGLLVRRKEIDAPLVRTAGWTLSLAGMASLASLLAPSLSQGPVIGSGGYLGALDDCGAAGGAILLASLTLAGLLLCTDYALPKAAAWSARATGKAGRTAMTKIPGRRGAAATVVTDLDAPDEAEDTEAEEESDSAQPASRKISVRKRSKAVSDLAPRVSRPPAVEDEEEDVEEDVEEAEGDEEEEAPVVKTRSKKRRKSKAEPAEDDGETTTRIDPPLNVRKPHKLDKAERDEVREQLDEGSQAADAAEYELPDIDLLIQGDDFSFENQEQEVLRKAKVLEETFASFGFNVKVVEIETGPVIAQYEIELEAGLRLSKITGLADDLAIALRVPSVRIVAPIPGKNTVGIEVPNEERQVVRLRDVMEEAGEKTQKLRIPLFLGKDVAGNPLVTDLSTLPHLLIAGRTGTGKSVCLNAIINSILMTKGPDEVRMLMIDPKMVELSGYATLPHLMHPVVTDMKKAEAILAWAVDKMEERYALLAKAGVRHIASYNQLGEEELYERLEPEDEEQKNAIPTQLPFIVIVADEIADLMMQAGKEVEQHIIRLAQKSRAVGIHLILATQKPTVDVITGLIKSNLPARICFQVASRTDSRVVLDEMGADKLLGNGDMLFLWPGTSTLLRGQGTYLTDEEINAVVDFVSTGEQRFVKELVNIKVNDESGGDSPGQLSQKDDLYESAVDIVVREGRGSVSLLQRALGIGYGRAARLIDYMAEDNIVGAYSGSNAREVLITVDEWERMQGHRAEEPTSRRPKPLPPPDDEEVEDGEEDELEEEEAHEEYEDEEAWEEEDEDDENYDDAYHAESA